MGRRILKACVTASLAAGLVGAITGCTDASDPESDAPSPALAFDRPQVESDIPQDLDIDMSSFELDTFRLVDDSTVEGTAFYIVRSTEQGAPNCVLVVRTGAATANAAAGCGTSSISLSGAGLPTTEFHPDTATFTDRDGWTSLGSGVWVAGD